MGWWPIIFLGCDQSLDLLSLLMPHHYLFPNVIVLLVKVDIILLEESLHVKCVTVDMPVQPVIRIPSHVIQGPSV